MEYFFDLLKIIGPALLVLWAAYSTMQRFITREENKQALEVSKKDRASALPLRLKAYERLTLYLERITPENLIQRAQERQMSCSELQMSLLKMIRQEYEHNLTQQLYVSDEAWEAVAFAKESVNQLINTSMSVVDPEEPSLKLAQLIIEAYHSSDTTPTQVAVKQLKAEVVSILS